MAFQALVTEIANEDLAGLVRYIARDNPAAAEPFGLALLEKLKLFRKHPLLGQIVPARGFRQIFAIGARTPRRLKRQRPSRAPLPRPFPAPGAGRRHRPGCLH